MATEMGLPTLKRLGEIKDGAWLRLTLYPWAYLWRRLLRRTRFIAITGSLGKTTTKELATACLAVHGPTTSSFSNRNGFIDMARNVLRVRPRHRFAVLETGTHRKGDIARLGRFLRPDIAVIVAVVMQHRSAFRTLEAIAAEKEQMALSVRRGGTVWLNGDDPLVAAMRVPDGVKRLRFGVNPEFDLWAASVTSCWPGRLSFTAHYRGETAEVTTQLVGEYWIHAALGALAVSLDCGMSLQAAAAALATASPMAGRMQPVTLANGVTVLRDDYKSSPDSYAEALKVLRQADAPRRWLVTSGYEETSQSEAKRARRIGREVQGVAERVIFLGSHAGDAVARALQEGMAPEHVYQAEGVAEAAQVLRAQMSAGDLILIKGGHLDHLARIFFHLAEDRYGRVACDRSHCGLHFICDECAELHEHHVPVLRDPAKT